MWNISVSINNVLFFISWSTIPGGNFWIAASEGTKTVKYLPTKISRSEESIWWLNLISHGLNLISRNSSHAYVCFRGFTASNSS